jgi:3'-phosphoadenosine 5'-phosphosulfate sulfotransferase (PAPS reductase)/FAD synthetase
MKHIVGFSGGIDSQACARWVLNRFPAEDVILLNSQAGRNEHPMTVEFVSEYSRTIHPVQEATPKVSDIWKTENFAATKGLDGEAELTFNLMAKIKGRFPSRRAQFCTMFLKIIPSARWIAENIPDGEFIRYTGRRRDESADRANIAFEEFDDYFGCIVKNPLADWTKQMCFDYVKLHGEPINMLYTLGFDRVGCAPCINSGKEDVKAWADRFPEMIDKVRRWEVEVGKTFFSPCVPGKSINWIDEVVEWSRTSRGGRQFNLLSDLERPSCESKFGLCE